jgi:hypothetical protein
MTQSGHFSIALSGRFFARPKAAPHCSQAPRLFVERVNFLIEPRHLGFRLISAAKLFERFANREFRGVSHRSPSRKSIQTTGPDAACGPKFEVFASVRTRSRLSSYHHPLIVVLKLHTTLLQRITHFMEDNDGERRHPPFLFWSEGLVERLPSVSKFFQVG